MTRPSLAKWCTNTNVQLVAHKCCTYLKITFFSRKFWNSWKRYKRAALPTDESSSRVVVVVVVVVVGFVNYSTPFPIIHCLHRAKKEGTIQYGYRKLGTHARVFSPNTCGMGTARMK